MGAVIEASIIVAISLVASYRISVWPKHRVRLAAWRSARAVRPAKPVYQPRHARALGAQFAYAS